MRTRRQRGAGVRGLGAAIVGLAIGLAPGCTSNSHATDATGSGQDAGGGRRDASGNGQDAGGGVDVGSGGNDGGGGGCNPIGSGNPTMPARTVATSSASTFASPFNSIPSPDGTKIYFLAEGGAGVGVFSVEINSGSPAAIVVGDPFATPIDLQVSADGNTLFIVDIGAEGPSNKRGEIFSMSTAGGTPAAIAAVEGLSPRGIDVVKSASGSDIIYFTGFSSTTTAAVFKVNADGTGLMTVASGGMLTEPGGLAVTKSGDIYVADSGSILKISNGQVTRFVSGITHAFPSGVALAADESALLVLQYDETTRSSVIGRYTLIGANKSTFNMGISTTTEPAGLHRARCADVYSLSNNEAAGRSGVYVLVGSQ